MQNVQCTQLQWQNVLLSAVIMDELNKINSIYAVLTLLDNLGQGGDNPKQGVVLWQSLLGL